MKKIIIILAILLLPSVSLAAFDVSLKFGSRGEAVEDLQEFLEDQGFYKSKIDGKFGFGTLRAVKAFQSAHGLKADGYFGKMSREKAKGILREILSASEETELAETGGIVIIDPMVKKIETPPASVEVPATPAPEKIDPIQNVRWFTTDGSWPVGGLGFETKDEQETGRVWTQVSKSTLKPDVEVRVIMDKGMVYKPNEQGKIWLEDLFFDPKKENSGETIHRTWTFEFTFKDPVSGRITGTRMEGAYLNVKK